MLDDSPARARSRFGEPVLEELAARLRRHLNIKTRSYGVPRKRYRECFVGSEAVHALIEADIAADEDEAVRIGNLLLDAGVFHNCSTNIASRTDGCSTGSTPTRTTARSQPRRVGVRRAGQTSCGLQTRRP